MQSYNIALIGFMNAVATIGYTYVATYVYKVKQDGCVCAEDWRQDFMMFYSACAVVIGVWISYACATGRFVAMVSKPLQIAIGIATCVYLYISYSYTGFLQENKCNCSQELHIVLLHVINFLNGLLVTYGITFVIFLCLAALTLKQFHA